jgi:signal recognition particle receptor subunit beta
VTEHVILFAGPMGAGKTTAIQALSDIEVVLTEAANSERHLVDKPTTTVALDYGEITISDEEKVRLYGIPGQRRFDFMWRILADRARGMVLLVNNDAPDPVALVLEFLGDFGELYNRGAVVIGITRSDLGDGPALADYSAALEAARPGIVVPIFTIDPRDAGQLRIALLVLIANIEMRAALGQRETQSA